jgi:hypothetical protein
MASTKVFDYLSAIKNPKEYLNFDDTIIHDIRISDCQELAHARSLLARFDCRKHYSFVAA